MSGREKRVGDDCWLRLQAIEDEAYRALCRACLGTIFIADEGPVLASARNELARGLRAMAGFAPSRVRGAGRARILMGTAASLSAAGMPLSRGCEGRLGEEGFAIESREQGGALRVILAGRSPVGALRAAFRLLEMVRLRESFQGLAVVENPANPLRMIDHWDNMDGTIERGYAGASLFFVRGRVVKNLSRVREYARLLASIGINAVAVNNVNVHAAECRLITPELLPDAARLAGVFRAWGIRLFLSVDYAAPVTMKDLPTADPLDPAVGRWWKERVSGIYSLIPDFGGFLVKADSEGRPGPHTYGRSHAEGANMLADALAPHGGLVLWRCFVYNCRQDWRDRSTDRARAAYDTFMPLDGRFRDNVLLQIKNGPMDFQVREPVSPLFGGMERTNQALELQITQEYTGQQKHLCCLVPQWKEYLSFDTKAGGTGGKAAGTGGKAAGTGGKAGTAPATLARIADGSFSRRPLGGIVGVSNVGSDSNWTGHHLAQANLYGFGRLAWDPDLTPEQVVDTWVRLTFGPDEEIRRTVSGMLLESWSIFESYTAPLGVGWMVNPGHHYGPSVDGYEYSRWGTYHFADCRGIGVDRSKATGTGYAGQYHPANSRLYESVDTCPEELLLFFHHVPYTHRLSSGATVIQHIYDSHFQGAERAAGLLARWSTLKGRIDEERWNEVRGRLSEQRKSAEEWRDTINTYFLRKSGIPDEKGRKIY